MAYMFDQQVQGGTYIPPGCSNTRFIFCSCQTQLSHIGKGILQIILQINAIITLLILPKSSQTVLSVSETKRQIGGHHGLWGMLLSQGYFEILTR